MRDGCKRRARSMGILGAGFGMYAGAGTKCRTRTVSILVLDCWVGMKW